MNTEQTMYKGLDGVYRHRVGQKYRYANIPRYFFGVVRTGAPFPIPRYSGVSIFSNGKP